MRITPNVLARGVKRLALALLALGAAAAGRAASPVAKTMEFGGVERHYLLVVPAPTDSNRPFPVVFIFHGANLDGRSPEKSLGFSQLAEQKHFIAVYPDGLDKRWNGTPNRWPSRKARKSDDVGFISALLDELEAQYKIDEKRVYATGSSNGAIFCFGLAARLSQRIAAIGTVSGIMPEVIPQKFPPTSPVSVILFNGTDDTLVHYNGEEGADDTGLLSVPNTIAYWVKVNGCEKEPTVTTLPRAVPDEGTTVIRLSYRKKESAAEVVAYIVGHGGHTWPGVPTDPGWAKTAGKTTMAVHATETMWEFFEAHPKP